MIDALKQFLDRFRASPAAEKPREYPATYVDLPADERVALPKVFDPALVPKRNAFRRGEPVFEDPELAQRWRAARRNAMHAILACVNRAPWTDVLVLRGSIVLKAWYGDRAREPGDIDWIVRSPNGASTKDWTTALIEGLVYDLRDHPMVTTADGQSIEFMATDARMDGIWTYECAPGKRLVIPWRSGDLPIGIVQCDLVSGEDLPLSAEQTEIINGLSVATAGKAMSLAWKLQWLETDRYPQGKDLYDAVLLAEDVAAPAEVVRKLIAVEWPGTNRSLEEDFPLRWQIEWDDFIQEYPWVKGTADEWKQRLADAIRLAFTNSSS